MAVSEFPFITKAVLKKKNNKKPTLKYQSKTNCWVISLRKTLQNATPNVLCMEMISTIYLLLHKVQIPVD